MGRTLFEDLTEMADHVIPRTCEASGGDGGLAPRHRRPPKRVTSWRVCPACGSRHTKLLSLNTGVYTCQICEHQYTWEPTSVKLRSTRTVRDWFWK
jgi:ribosomal protein L37AE/L43A